MTNTTASRPFSRSVVLMLALFLVVGGMVVGTGFLAASGAFLAAGASFAGLCGVFWVGLARLLSRV